MIITEPGNEVPAGTFQNALEAFGQGRLADAASICQEILQADIRQSDAAHLLGLILTRAGDNANARNVLGLAASVKPFDGSIRLALADAGRPADPAAARIEVQRAVLAEPGIARAWGARAVGFSAIGAGAAFGRAARAGVVLAPGDADLQFLYSQSLASRDQASGRRDALKRAVLLQPGHQRAVRELSDFLSLDEQIRTCARLCQIAPLDPSHWLARAGLSGAGGTKGAARDIRRALVLNPADTDGWRAKLSSSSSKLRTARAMSVCAPYDVAAWEDRARREHADGNSGLAEIARARVSEIAAYDPDTQLAHALAAFEEGRANEAGGMLEAYFSNCDRLLRTRDPHLKFADGLAAFLRMTLFEGRLDLLQTYLECAGDGFAGTGIPSAEFVKMRYMRRALQEYRECRHRWSGGKRLVVSVPVWGESIGQLWLENALPAMMAPGNRKLWDRGETLFLITTTPETRRKFERDPVFRDLMSDHAHVFLDISPVLEEWVMEANYVGLMCSQWLALLIAMQERADCFQICADHIFAGQSLGHIADLLDRGEIDLFCTVDLPVSISAQGLLERFRLEEGGLDIPEDALVRIFLDHISARVSHYMVDPQEKSLPADPSRLNARLEGGVQLRSTQPQLAYIVASALEVLWVPFMGATDNGAVDWALESGVARERVAMLTDLEKFVCGVLEFDDVERAESGYFSEREGFAEPVADRLRAILSRQGYFTEGRRWALGRPVTVAGSGANESEATRLLDSVAGQVRTEPANGLTRMMSQLGQSAFRRFLSRLDANGEG
ncbi:hypothetical protein NUH88_08155 [Nisaea acidiphila]|uniref:Tetratricopeptide repeat protein n=1 Tax=Nisaea acidiphila TaxID=1862145 RepID=A0A9J7B1W6_9PROT|nr:hypothetical protein [Nisaea acidiphila]UUX51661.1 hypothetical protein NUH88_08155 [Nisaea acidiphila]